MSSRTSPEFDPGTGPQTTAPWGTGDMQVDYDRTFADMSRFFDDYRPAAVVTFSRCKPGSHWKLEPASMRFRLPNEAEPADLATYTTDGRSPGFPVMHTDPPGTSYRSSLPMDDIARAVEAATDGRVAGLVPPIDVDYDYGGPYLSGFASYLGTRYATVTPTCRMAGHVHVGRNVSIPDAILATEATLRTVIEHLMMPTDTARTV